MKDCFLVSVATETGLRQFLPVGAEWVTGSDRPKKAENAETPVNKGRKALHSFECRAVIDWWWGEDSNLRRHRQQIYSLCKTPLLLTFLRVSPKISPTF